MSSLEESVDANDAMDENASLASASLLASLPAPAARHD